MARSNCPYRVVIVLLFGALLLASAGSSLGAQADDAPLDLLIVDETKTFEASLLVNTAASALKQTGMFNVEAKFVDVNSSFDDPLGLNKTGSVYDVIVIVPRALEQRDLMQVWVATCPYLPGGPDELKRGVETVQDLVDARSQGQLTALGVHDDALPALFATIFANHGWLNCN
ncbi:MAG: hypothetical protein ABEK03_01685 [Candidatus Bipolaricaulia bacterium]